MDRYERYEGEEDVFYDRRDDYGFNAAVATAMEQAPWWVLSVAAHAMLLLVMLSLTFTEYREDEVVLVTSSLETPTQEEDEEKVERDIFEKDLDINPEEPPIEDPVLKDAQISDHNETDDNEDWESSKGVEDAVSDKPFQGKYWNSAIGIGGGAGGTFGGRFGGRRNLRAYGGGRHTESAVLMGLIWLKNHQNPDGMWSCRKFMMNCRSGTCSGPGSSDAYDEGVTGLAALAFLGAGHTHKHGRFKSSVKSALRALKDRQGPDGCFGEKTGEGHWIYNHAICTMAAAEAYGVTKSPLLHGMAQKSVDFLVDCQNPYLGWRYGSRPGDNDTSVTGWAVLALKSAKIGGLHVPRESFDGALRWFDKVTDQSYYKAGYTSRGDTGARLASAVGKFQPTEAMTAAAVISRIFILGPSAQRRPEVVGGGNLLKRSPPKWNVRAGTIDMYYWYYGTLAMFQLGGSYWRAWNEPMKDALVPTQRDKGCQQGSWDPVGAWGEAGGRVYSTAINCLSLEIYYRYGRVLNVK